MFTSETVLVWYRKEIFVDSSLEHFSDLIEMINDDIYIADKV